MRYWALAQGRTLELGAAARIMGVLNVTPDSFSDGGDLNGVVDAISHAMSMVGEGAHIVDIGGESTRPGAEPVSGDEERARILPVIAELARTDCLLSVDSYRAKTAAIAVEAGCHVINDVWGCQKEPDIARVAADTKAGLVIMHTSRDRETLDDPIADQKSFLSRSLDIALAAGVAEQAIVLDPGIGFGKGNEESLALLSRMEELHMLGFPILLGTSRKRFLGALTGHDDAKMRDVATTATSVIGRLKGASIFRVHDVAANRDALCVADAVLASSKSMGDGRKS